MRRATPGDRPAIEAFLRAHVDTSMFPLSNLARYGMAGGHERAMRFWLSGEPVGAVLGVTEAGLVMPQVPPGRASEAARALDGEAVIGILGESGQVAALREAMGLQGGPAQLDEEERLFALDLADLRMPDTAGLRLVPLAQSSREVAVRWRADYGQEALGWTGDTRAQAERDVTMDLASGQHRVLLQDGEPVAGTGFNARLGHVVQVGGVWTPPELRGRGLARAAVALHLAEARDEGATRAVLFTKNPYAARAYQAVGFREIGRFTLLVFGEAREVRPG